MLRKYVSLIRRYTDELQSGMWEGTTEYLNTYDQRQKEYTVKMNRLYKRLQQEHNFTKKKWYAFQEQSMTF